MNRRIYLTGAIVLIAVLALIVKDILANPIRPRKEAHIAEIALIDTSSEPFVVARELDYAQLENSIIGKESLWKELIAPKKKPPPKPKQPNLQKKLKGISATRQQIGSGDTMKIQFVKTEKDKKTRFWKRIGGSINGLKISAITNDKVEFSMKWKDKVLTTSLTRK